MSDDEELIRFVQEHRSSTVTSNFIKTLRKLVENCRGDSNKFVAGCKALGGFQGQDEFLGTLFVRLNGRKAIPLPPVKRKIRLQLDLDEDEDENEDGEEQDIPLFKPKRNPSQFKRIDKNTAQKLKEFNKDAAVLKDKDKQQISTTTEEDKSGTSIGMPKLQAVSDNEEEDQEESGNDTDGSVVSEDSVAEDREWYNYDDDYGNPVTEEPAKDMDFKNPVQSYKNFKMPTTSVQLYTMPVSQRKQFLPPFLKKNYQLQGVTDATIVGSFLDSPLSGLVNPFKNPDGELSVSAKKGSHLVALRRLQKDKTQRSREAADVVGTALGDVLGLKEKDQNQTAVDVSNDATDQEVSSREDILQARKSLPAYAMRSQIIQTIRDNQVTIIIGETGSGKTTQLAQYLDEAGICQSGKSIGCTQPRRVAAMSVAKRVALEMGVELGQEVGYSIRFEDCTSNKTKIKFMTDGILLREALMDHTLEKYDCIIIDEAHERSLNTDVILGLFKRLLARRRDIKLIITSATINATKFADFFGGAPLCTIPGRTFPIQIIYSKHPVSDYVEASVMQAIRIHLSADVDAGDILIFMTGQEDIEATNDALREKLTEVYSKSMGITRYDEINNVEIFPIYSALPADVQSRIFKKLESGKRKIVISTNIAETSLTIDGIRYVVDCGFSKLKVYNPKIGLDSLTITPISRANADQRSGRAGRTGPGTAYRMYTEDAAYDDMYSQAIPEIQRTNLSNTVLLLKSLHVDDILKFPFIDPPPLQTLLASLYELHFLGALDNFGNLTSLGTEMSKLPLRPSLSKALLISARNGCSEEMVTIVSMLSVPIVFYRPTERQKESDQARSRFFVPESDHLTFLNVYSQWKSNRYSHRWCGRHFLQYRSLQRARDIRVQLVKIMQSQGIPLVSSGTEWDIVRRCICSGFAHQAAKISGLGKYVHLKTGMEVQLHPTSALYGMGDLPPFVVYNELLMTTKEYISCVTSVDPFWLMDYGGLLYDIKRIKEIDNNDVKGFFQLVDEPQEREDEPDELDLRMKDCLAARDRVIRRLEESDKKFAQQNSDSLRSSSSSSSNKRDTDKSVQIGFKRRRPF
ncbi:ZYRO0A11814p [Zygosaccharomyces rouxii]|uniref:Pre-mRNA-splicing factor ATP-dependent RNA helicase PRP16 n=1 Tax=Zygosaccharomyces rouxii (strain ATCC 2623 / CBS 732 / NBRC 1130 / NCYC 568 / NRRL Y-229) TaxID=559307 RepID=C5DNV5_ZYGRC|nr:uncharacterized protein ZYRO0A11814g [Zygosaccharomyces rouxii]KAH9198530.1 P-loop containing nucleoside triphosphate hydrolase protein [Zygosaccharomyces rouxii]CAR25946.1 ZYRO0A11814p [Zygosaccharomyces rouxii]